jgi:hypothetical protein
MYSHLGSLPLLLTPHTNIINVTIVPVLLLLLAMMAAPTPREKATAREEVKVDHQGVQLAVQEADLRDSDMNMDKTRWDSVEANELAEERPRP